MIDPQQVHGAARRLAGIANRTPILTSRTLDEQIGARVFLKAENQQRAGAFKFRGAYNAIASLPEAKRNKGLVTLSSGNHAQATALAARLLDAQATILIPSDAPATKLEATRGYGAEVVLFERDEHDFDELLEATAQERGLTPLHPYDDWDVMAGAGTATLELLEDAGPLDILVICLGGGGLLAGACLATAVAAPDVRVYGVEPEASDDYQRSLLAGERVRVKVGATIADGQMLATPGVRNWEVIAPRVAGVETVTDAEVLAAMRFLFERLKTVTEPSGATALAALMSGRMGVRGARVGVTLSGGNIGAQRFADLIKGAPAPASAVTA